MATITGTASADTLSGTSGSDVFTAGAGHDVIVFDARGGGQTDVVADFGATYFGGPISGAQEVPPVNSSASGTFSGALNRAQTEFNFTATITGLDLGGQTPATNDNVTAAHFHRAPAGVSGGVVFGFIGAPNNETQGETTVSASTGTVTGSWDLQEGNNTTLAAQLPALLSNQIYINFHTPVAPAGEIRGQANMLDSGADRIDVSSLGATNLASLLQIATEAGGSTTLTAHYNGVANALVLTGVPIARLSAADFIFAPDGAPIPTATDLADDLFGGSGVDRISGAGGDDRIFGAAGSDILEGGAGADIILGMEDSDAVRGGAGDDDIQGNMGEDVVRGDGGADTVRGGQGNDTVEGGSGADPHVNGNMGSDTVRGGADNDTVYGGRDDDIVFGDDGNDWLSGDLGQDIVFGGGGADRFLFRLGAGIDWVGDFNAAEGDRIQLAPGVAFTMTSHAGQAMVTLSSGESIGLAGVSSADFNAQWVVFA